MKRLWLIFAQSVTVTLAALFVLSAMQPGLLPWHSPVVAINQVAPAPAGIVPAKGSSFSDAAKRAMPSVVNISTRKRARISQGLGQERLLRRFFGAEPESQPRDQSSLGSGVIVSSQGYILTNHHVVDAADAIEVSLADGRSAPARLIGADPDSDLAVLKVNLVNLPAITFGHSDQAAVGDVVLAIGDPFGVGQTVTMGIVSAVGRSRLGINTYENFIQTDAAINPGNSGGALIDTSGNLIGINSAIYSKSGGSQGIGFSIPVSIARNIMEQIIQTGGVTRGWIGVEVQDISPQLAESLRLPNAQGALIAGILGGGPADQAQMRPGDVLLAVNGKLVNDSASTLNLISELAPGAPANLLVLRENAQLVLQVNVGKRPKPRQSTLAASPDE